MHITILTIGSRGDVQPFIALALGLKQAGHIVRLATHANFEAEIRSLGLEFALVSFNPQEELQKQAGQALLRTGKNPITFFLNLTKMVKPYLTGLIKEAWEACQGTDATIVCIWLMFTALDYVERLGIPLYIAGFQPTIPTRAFPSPNTPPELERLGVIYNRLTYSLILFLLWQLFSEPTNEFRSSVLKLPPIPFLQGALGRINFRKLPFLHAYSREVVPPPCDWSEHTHVTGYWYLDKPANFSPPQDLIDFLAAGLPPVYIGFGSMVGEAAEATAEIALAALAKTGHRGIFLKVWGGIRNGNLPDNVFMIESIPHDWLFPQMVCIIHHGGAGTTAAAFRAGVPGIAIPFCFDQPFWGYRAAKLGVSPKPILSKELTVDKLVSAIEIAVNDKAMRQRALALREKICAENGVAEAVRVFHRYLTHTNSENLEAKKQ